MKKERKKKQVLYLLWHLFSCKQKTPIYLFILVCGVILKVGGGGAVMYFTDTFLSVVIKKAVYIKNTIYITSLSI